MATTEDNDNFHYMQNDPHRLRLNFKNFILISCVVQELLRKISAIFKQRKIFSFSKF